MKTKSLYLRPLTSLDVTDKYISWLNNPNINQYLEIWNYTHTYDNVRSFVESINSKDNEFLFGIFLLNTDEHIGNIKVGPIKYYHLVADVSYLIGEESAWGKGYATEAIKAISEYAFKELGVNKLSASLYISNVGSGKALEKAGFLQEGHRIKHAVLKGQLEDIIEYGMTKP